MQPPLVSVICLCYNHERFVREAVVSVMEQTYPNVELILVDDASTDNSAEVIAELVNTYPSIRFIKQEYNLGNCAAFNNGSTFASGEFMIDLAADDVLLPNRIEKGVAALNAAGSEFGVHFSDAEWIGEDGHHLRNHSERFPHDKVPQGDVYVDLIEKYFICSPSMMFRSSVIEKLSGYDETLAYEDFDFWIRSSRSFKYCYSPEILVKKRVVENSLSTKQFKPGARQQESTYAVCRKIFLLNRSREEKKALGRRIRYEIGVSLRLLSIGRAIRYAVLGLRNV